MFCLWIVSVRKSYLRNMLPGSVNLTGLSRGC
jgi:hypothetical protein